MTKDCPKNCKLCCNKNFDLEKLPIVQHFDYDEIIITGGEPFAEKTEKITESLINYLKFVEVNPNRKVFAYTALPFAVVGYHDILDGMTLSLHTKSDVNEFIWANMMLLSREDNLKSLRLKLFEGVTIPSDIDLSLWEVTKDVKWIENCPLPSDEIFMRLKNI